MLRIFKRRSKQHPVQNVKKETPVDYNIICGDIINYANSLLKQIKDIYPHNTFEFKTSFDFNDYCRKYTKIEITLNHDRQFTIFNKFINEDLLKITPSIKKYITDNYSNLEISPYFNTKFSRIPVVLKYIEQIRYKYPNLIIYHIIKHISYYIDPIVYIYVNRKNYIDNDFITQLNLKFRETYGLYTVPRIVYNNKYDETSSLQEIINV